MPSFCRHNRLIQNCPICSREQAIELRPLLSSSAPRSTQPRESDGPANRGRGRTARPAQSERLQVRRLARGADDGYRSALAPGLRSSADAERLAEELGFSSSRLNALERTPPGLYAEVGDSGGELEERTWLAFLIAYLGPLDEDDPFASIERVRRPWGAPGGDLSLRDARPGPRGAYDPGRSPRTVEAYRAWAARAGSQAAALGGEPSWSAERRFERLFERLALPGLSRDARFDLLVTLGWLGLYELRAGKLALGGENEVTVAAKRVFGIGDPLLLERRAAQLTTACELPLEALDLALFNWGRGAGLPGGPDRATAGLGPDAKRDTEGLARARDALGL